MDGPHHTTPKESTMHLALRSIPRRLTLILTAALLTFAVAAQAAPRVPQVVFPGASLQSYLNSVGESINVLTDQVDAQAWITSVSGNTSFTIMIELAGNAPFNSIGVYNGNDPNGFPTLFQVFPGNAGAGWFAQAHFAFGGLVVTLFDQNAVIQGQTAYGGVNASNFGFYLSGPAGTFYSQDARNAGSEPHMLTYAGTGQNAGDWWEAFEDSPWSEGEVDFDDAVLLMQSVVPTPSAKQSWGAIKRIYR
jgi:hypothetical protein